jgi:mRNA-degrading endonuclease toxin of MazEF toxin-antitoxin module
MLNRADVVLVDWPDSDMLGSKLRPAVVVQADFLNGILDDTVFVQITGTKHGIPGTEVEIDPTQETGSGLVKVSYASCMNVLAREQALVDQTLGSLSATTMQKIEECLKVVLRIP